MKWLATFFTITAIFGVVGRLITEPEDRDPSSKLPDGWAYKWVLFYRVLPYAAGAAVVLWAIYFALLGAS